MSKVVVGMGSRGPMTGPGSSGGKKDGLLCLGVGGRLLHDSPSSWPLLVPLLLRIKREIATMKLIKHPNVVRIYEGESSLTK
ncbi:hypothetical protein C4D60_Mb07t05860 [Musa balbisiana]|uniref:Protein kinase domain-containing protein n=1 Tax=Musa balbisiana TaxID=52838 RepID=A0A4S8JDF0_MUSBA|nr:hypothetical protein C4D60_Mb07t05860 [Musa balbisiana]